jgi:hypothetical protein
MAQHYVSDSFNNNYVPVITWYEMANGYYTGVFVAQLTSLNTPSTMNTYFGDFVLLLQRLASVSNPNNKPIIIHMEPDLWGFIQQHSWDPTATPAAVASSGYSGLGAFANNAAGFAQALVHLRDVYAPSVLLAWHASLWGPNNGYSPTRVSPPSYQSPSTTGGAVGDFYNAFNAAFDMIFHDTSDMDAAFYVANCNTSQNIHRGWWDNTAFANFESYLGAIYAKTTLKNVLWQTPEGNTLYDTENNTSGHYQDNRPQYFLLPANRSHMSDFFTNAGLWAILFGGGQQSPYSQCNSAQSDTFHWDFMADGITNPAPIIGNPYSGTPDNALTSSYSDDDGGFIRINGATYLSNPVNFAPPSCHGQ